MMKRREVFNPTHPVRMSPEQRLGEVATILATGIIRMPKR